MLLGKNVAHLRLGLLPAEDQPCRYVTVGKSHPAWGLLVSRLGASLGFVSLEPRLAPKRLTRLRFGYLITGKPALCFWETGLGASMATATKS